MYVKRLEVRSFRSFSECQKFIFSSGLNCIVGDNNCGKSSIFAAIQYLINGGSDAGLRNVTASEPMQVTIDLAGSELCDVLNSDRFSKKNYAEYVFADSDNEKCIRLQRSPEPRAVQQDKKTVTLDAKKIGLWNPKSDQFENPSGIDADYKRLIEFAPVWADLAPSDAADFGTTKTLGKILAETTKSFASTEVWRNFEKAHKKAFSARLNQEAAAEEASLAELAQKVGDKIQNLVRAQYGEATVRIDFDMPDASTFIKNGQIIVNDGEVETELKDKGTGMQRAIALALIQVLAETSRAGTGSDKPLILMIDEPETWLHPQAQLTLGSALCAIAAKQQLFLITHSPYLFRSFAPKNDQLIVMTGMGSTRKIDYKRDLGLTKRGEPSWGEINFHAFGIPSSEFLDELYALLIKRIQREGEDEPKEHDCDEYLKSHDLPGWKKWVRTDGKAYKCTRPVYVRNAIHHMENDLNEEVTPKNLAGAIKDLLTILKTEDAA